MMSSEIIALKNSLQQAIIGQPQLLEKLLIALITEGHVLIEGPPGLAKTTTVRLLAEAIDLRFQRIQFTPDLIPGDITGTEIFHAPSARFEFSPGPIFHEIILADEINRAPPKVQAALLEAMQEKQVTVGGQTHPLPELFFVCATQNPIEHEGTYPLPEAQLDRFLIKIPVDYPSLEDELEILRRAQEPRPTPLPGPAPLVTRDVLLNARRAAAQVYLDEMLQRYIVRLTGATREPATVSDELVPLLDRGASPRASLALARCAKARALLHQRDFVEPGDIMDLVPYVFMHRIALSFAARADGVSHRSVLDRIVDLVPVP